jgi:beta-phosphoglucomutase-like phosphatase (HAD superfamily)
VSFRTTPLLAIVFDFDGVLADSEPLHLRALQEVIAPLGITVERAEYYERYLGYDDVGAFRAIAGDRGIAITDEDIDTLRAAKSVVYQSLLTSGVLYEGASACVERLATGFPLGIASGALRHEIEAILRAGALDRHFRFIVASGDTPAGKPAPDPYLRAAALHGLEPSQCVAIEDSVWGIESAHAAGMKCVGITHSYPASELAGADAIVASLDEFTEELIRTM